MSPLSSVDTNSPKKPAQRKPSLFGKVFKRRNSKDVEKTATVGELVNNFMAGFWNGTSVRYTTDDCLFNPPGAPPTPIAELLEMLKGCKIAFPEWRSEVHGVRANADGTYTVLTQQILGPMKADLPAMGPFPPVALADVPAVMLTDLRLPVEVGTYTLSADGAKIAQGSYAGLTEEVPGVTVSEAVAAMWNQKGDLSDVGFGALFGLMGVALPPPPPPPSAPVDVFMAAKVACFADWLPCFQEHAHSATFHYKGVAHTVSAPRSAAVPNAGTAAEEVFCCVDDENDIVLPFAGVDMAKMGELMSEPAFVEGIKDAVVEMAPPMAMGEMPTEGTVGALFFSYEVADADRWIAGFKAHAHSKTGTWGVEAALTRAEICDEARTKIFRSAAHANRVGALLYDVDLAKMGEFMGHPSFATIAEVLAVKMDTMAMKALAPLPPPPAVDEPAAAAPAEVAAPAAAAAAPPPLDTVICPPADGPPDKCFGPEGGAQAKMWLNKFADGRQAARIAIDKGFDWRTSISPMLPGCPEWCPATHFGYLESGTMGIKMRDGTERVIRAGETYFVPPGHLPIMTEDSAVMVEFTQDTTYTKDIKK